MKGRGKWKEVLVRCTVEREELWLAEDGSFLALYILCTMNVGSDAEWLHCDESIRTGEQAKDRREALTL
jgi:hypothetical protein